MTKINLIIVDDQRLMREGLQTILNLEPDLEVVGLAGNGAEALELVAVKQPDIVLLDIRMPVMDGVECTGRIKADYPETKVLVLTTFDDDEYIVEALRRGAAGYLLKDLPAEKLVAAIRDLYQGGAILQPEIAAKLISHLSPEPVPPTPEGPDALTQREKEILQLVAQGLSNREIAGTLFISEGTVKNYISSIYAKIGVTERSKAIIYAINHKYV